MSQSIAPSGRRADHELRRLSRAYCQNDLDQARWILVAKRAGTAQMLGLGSFAEYMERLFGYAPHKPPSAFASPRPWSTSRAPKGPRRRNASSGPPSASSPRRDPRDRGRWIKVAQGKTVRRWKGSSPAIGRASRPGDLRSEDARRHVLRFEVTGETYASFEGGGPRRGEMRRAHRRRGGAPAHVPAGAGRTQGRGPGELPDLPDGLRVMRRRVAGGRGELVPVEKETLDDGGLATPKRSGRSREHALREPEDSACDPKQ